MADADVRKGMPPVELSRDEFEARYRRRFIDPAFAPLHRELDAIVAAAWDAYSHGRKAPAAACVQRRARVGRAAADGS